jgi:hypothetical protein
MTTRSFTIAATALFLAVSGALALSAAPDAEPLSPPPKRETIPVTDIYAAQLFTRFPTASWLFQE